MELKTVSPTRDCSQSHLFTSFLPLPNPAYLRLNHCRIIIDVKTRCASFNEKTSTVLSVYYSFQITGMQKYCNDNVFALEFRGSVFFVLTGLNPLFLIGCNVVYALDTPPPSLVVVGRTLKDMKNGPWCKMNHDSPSDLYCPAPTVFAASFQP